MFEVETDDPRYARQMTEGRPKRGNAFDRDAAARPKPLAKPVRQHDLDREVMVETHKILMGYYRRELTRQEENREEMAKDADFYDGKQLSDEMIAHLKERGQTPLTFNVVANVINWMLGTERRARTDYRILPRREDASQSAERKSELLKYLADVNREPFHWSRAFADCVRVGLGWIEDGVQEDDEGEPLYSRYESWRNIIHDSAATELDMSDARYMFRSKWVDVDVGCDLFPDRKAEIERAATTNLILSRSLEQTGDDAMDARELEAAETSTVSRVDGYRERKRVRLIECWYRKPHQDQYMHGGEFSGELYDSRSHGHVQAYLTGQADIVKRTKMRVHVAIMTEHDMLWHSQSPYRHNRFPFTPIWCYRRDRDNLPYGLVRQMRDPQIDVNHRATKALHILNSSKTIMDKGAVDDLKAFEREAASADSIIIKNPGKELVLDADRGLEQAHLDMMSRSMTMIQQLSGITDENMGRETNANSGRAIMARQDQGALATAPIFDNLRLAKQISGEKKLSLMEQFMTEQRQFRITNTRGNPQFIRINDGMPDNDIISTKADYIVSEQDHNTTMRQAQVQELMNLMGQLAGTGPEIVVATLDLIIETMDVPQREEIVKRIRQITGQVDPDEDPANPSPETMERQAAMQEQEQIQRAMVEAELRSKQAGATKAEAEAERAMAQARQLAAEIRRIIAQTEGESVDTQVRALEAAAQIMASPQMANIADTVLDTAGFQDRTDNALVSRAMRKLGRNETPPAQPAAPPPAAGTPPPAMAPRPTETPMANV